GRRTSPHPLALSRRGPRTPARVISRRTRRTPAYSAVPAGSTSALRTPPGGPREPLDEVVRDRLAWGEGDAGLGGLVARGRDLFGVLGDGVREEVEAALLAERGVARDDRAADREARHVVRHGLLGVGQRARQDRAQPPQLVVELPGCRGD